MQNLLGQILGSVGAWWTILAAGRGRWRGGSGDLGTRPDQYPAVLICRHALAVDQRILEVFDRRIIKLELPLEGAVGHPPPALEHGDRLVENLLKGHRPPSLCRGGVEQTVWEWEKSVGLVIPQMGDKRKPQAWPRGTAPCHGARRRGGGPESRIAPSDAACHVRSCCEGRLGPRSAPGCRTGTMTRYRRRLSLAVVAGCAPVRCGSSALKGPDSAQQDPRKLSASYHLPRPGTLSSCLSASPLARPAASEGTHTARGWPLPS